MTINGKRIMIAVSGVMLNLLIVALAIWTFGPVGGGSLTDVGMVDTNLHYVVRDSSGNILEQQDFHNATVENLINAASTRLHTAANIAATDVFTAIALCGNNPNSAITDGDAASQCTLNADADLDENNPKAANAVNIGAGTYSAVQTFTASQGMTISELQLAKNPVNNTAPGTDEIGAVRNVSITLATGDTLTITWTITIS